MAENTRGYYLTYILGINPAGPHIPLSHDPSACLLKDGKLIAAVEEERFVRVKKAWRYFPVNSIAYCMQIADLDISDLDCISICLDPSTYKKAFFLNLYRILRSQPQRLGMIAQEASYLRDNFLNAIEYFVKRLIRGNYAEIDKGKKIDFVPHHLAHAASAYYLSGFREASVLTIDWAGEIEATVLWHGKESDLIKKKSYNFPNSLGFYYYMFTRFLGYKHQWDAGKIMGLAPYGKHNPKYQETINSLTKTSKEYNVKKLARSNDEQKIVKTLSKKLGIPPKIGTESYTQPYKDIAYIAQKKLEEMVLNLVKKNYEETKSKNLALAGGVALNCKMNKALMKSDYVDKIFIQPAADDAGLSIGAALVSCNQMNIEVANTLTDVSLGPSFHNDNIQRVLEQFKLEYQNVKNAPKIAAELVSEGKLVGWFQGRMELGPRGLGNRSIIADPRNKESKDKVNFFVKRRENWRPFAPSLLTEAKEEYLVDAEDSRFMIKSFDVIGEKKAEIPAVVHVDGTTRPQTVDKDIKPRYYDMIYNFKKITSVPVVLNTSFNLKGEPIVCTPEDAIVDFYRSGLDSLIIEDYLLLKNK